MQLSNFPRRFAFFCLLAVGACLVSPRSAQGQTTTNVGVRLGVASMTIDGGAQNSRGRRTGGLGGGYVRFGAPGWFSFQPELLYVQKGASKEFRAGGTTVTEVDKLGVIEIPLLVRMQVPSTKLSPTLSAGPVVGHVVRSASSLEAEGSLPDDLAPPVPSNIGAGLGLMIGAGVNVQLSSGTFTVDARYQMEPHAAQHVGNQGLTFTVGYER